MLKTKKVKNMVPEAKEDHTTDHVEPTLVGHVVGRLLGQV